MDLLEKQLKTLVDLFSQTKTGYAVLGGLAVIIYGEPRLTMDIDVNISIDKDKIDFFLTSAREFGFYPIPKNIKSFIKNTGVIPMRLKKDKSVGRCDIIIAESPIEYIALKRARLKKFGSVSARFISPEDLVIHKITSDRARDIEDLKGILIRQQGKLDMEYIFYWLKKIARANKKPKLLKLFQDMLLKRE